MKRKRIASISMAHIEGTGELEGKKSSFEDILVFFKAKEIWKEPILGDPGAASREDRVFMGESLQQERESPWALTLTERVPEAFEIPPSDWPEKFFSGQSAKRNSRATLMSSYTRLFSSSIAVVAWPVQREHF